MTTSVEIGQAGEKAAVGELKSKGWKITKWDTNAPGSTDIEAEGTTGKKILIQVKSAVEPGDPATLSGDEERNIKSRATKIGADAWEARVFLDKNLHPTNVIWRPL